MIFRFNTTCLALYVCLFPITPTGNSCEAYQKPVQPHIKFQWVGSGKTMKKGAVEVSFSRYRSQDGILVERFVESYHTDQAALTELEELRRRASKVHADGPKNDFQGKHVGRRVELLHGSSNGKPEYTVVAW